MFQPNPPTPKAMSDDELNAAIANLQLQPDGLVAAMALIEEQSRLRQEDALELSKWQLEAQMQAAANPEVPESEKLKDPAIAEPKALSQNLVAEEATSATSEPEAIDIFAGLSPAPVSSAPVVSKDLEEKLPPPVAAESIDDVVAALNASYAQAATEPEVFQSEPEVVSEPVLGTEQEAEPVRAAVLTETSSEQAVEVFVDENTFDEDQLPATAKASSLSWAWLAVSSSPVTLLLAAFLKDSGASLAQSVVLLAGVLLGTSLLAAIGSVASARGSSPLSVISRAAFGVWGNYLPAVLVMLARLLWAAAILYFSAKLISPLIFNQPWFAAFAANLVLPAEFTSLLFALIPLLLLGSIVAALGRVVLLRFQQVTTVISLIGLAAFIYFVATSYSVQDLAAGESLGASSLMDLALLSFAIFGFTVFSISGDFAKNLPEGTPSAKVFFLSFVSTLFLPLLVGLTGVVWLFMAGETLESSFNTEALATVASAAPIWVFVIFVVAIGLSLLHLIATTMHSIFVNRISIAKIPNWIYHFGGAIKVAVLVVLPVYLVAATVLQESIVELLLIAAVVAAAWAGILVSDALARRRGFHEVSLTREYGFYGRANMANIIGFVLAVSLGLGYLNGGVQLTFWAGYLGDLTPEVFEIAGSNIGILMAFGLAALFPVVLGIPRIRKQEHNLSELDQRRQELKEFLDGSQ